MHFCIVTLAAVANLDAVLIIFKEVTIILDKFNCSCINISGYKRLNGSQILKENITYILNTLKSCVNETELKKTVLQ